jgi:hypothetical protein
MLFPSIKETTIFSPVPLTLDEAGQAVQLAADLRSGAKELTADGYALPARSALRTYSSRCLLLD